MDSSASRHVANAHTSTASTQIPRTVIPRPVGLIQRFRNRPTMNGALIEAGLAGRAHAAQPTSDGLAVHASAPTVNGSQAVPISHDPELGDNAHIWTVFRSEIHRYDQGSILQTWHASVDVLLVFAALFLGVVTAFVIQIYSVLLDKSPQTTPGSHGYIAAIPALFKVIIVLWLISLTLSLAVSLGCILSKQWLRDYTRRLAEPTSTVREWARRRWMYMHALRAWGLDAAVSEFLPTLIHIALGLFSVGLVILLSTFVTAISWIFCAIASLIFLFYLSTTISRIAWMARAAASARLLDVPRTPGGDAAPGKRSWFTWVSTFVSGPRWDEEQGEQDLVGDIEDLTVQWLLSVSPSDDARAVAFCAARAFPAGSKALQNVRKTGVCLSDALRSMGKGQISPNDVARVIRSELHLRPGDWNRPKLGVDISGTMVELLLQSKAPEAGLLYGAMHRQDPQAAPGHGLKEIVAVEAARWRNLESKPLPQTISLLLQCNNITPKIILYLMVPLCARDIRDKYNDFAAALGEKVPDGTLALIQSPSRPTVAADVLWLLVNASTQFVTAVDDFATAAKLAARIGLLMRVEIKDSPVDGRAGAQGDTSGDLRLPFLYQQWRDPTLSWCRLYSLILRSLVLGWCLCQHPHSSQRSTIARLVGIVLESLLNLLDDESTTPKVRNTIRKMLISTFLETTQPLPRNNPLRGTPRRIRWEEAAAAVFAAVETAHPKPFGEKLGDIPAVTDALRLTAAPAWNNILGLRLSHETLLRLAITLASTLCGAQRDPTQGDRSYLHATFLSADALPSLLSDSSRLERTGPAETYLHLAQHCVELDGDWCKKVAVFREGAAGAMAVFPDRRHTDAPGHWLDALLKTRPTAVPHVPRTGTDSVRLRNAVRYYMAEQLQAGVAAHGPCTSAACPGRPPTRATLWTAATQTAELWSRRMYGTSD